MERWQGEVDGDLKFRNSLFLNWKQLLFKMYKFKRTGLNTRLFPAGSLSFFCVLINDIWKSLSYVWLFATPWIVACQAPLSMEFSRQECWSGLPFHSPGILLTQGLNSSLLHCRQILYHMSACVLSHCSCVQLCATLWTVACQAPLSMRFSRQEYRSGLPFPSPLPSE